MLNTTTNKSDRSSFANITYFDRCLHGLIAVQIEKSNVAGHHTSRQDKTIEAGDTLLYQPTPPHTHIQFGGHVTESDH